MKKIAEPPSIKLTSSQNKIIQAAAQICLQPSEMIGFVCRSLISASIPHAEVKGHQYTRQNNKFKLTITSTESGGGIPYGVYPRLILLWIVSEVIKKKSRDIEFGESLSEFMKRLGLTVTGGQFGTIHRFKEQLRRLLASVISFSYEDRETNQWCLVNMTIVDKAFMNGPDGENKPFGSKMTISEAFYKEIIKSPVPVDIRAVNALKDSSLALDIYFWLTYRMSYLKQTSFIPYERLHEQFGVGYPNTPHGRYGFKRKFSHQLQKVLTLYPEANISTNEQGITIFPSKTHVKRKRLG